MKKAWIWVLIVLVIIGVGYYYKHQIKLLLMGGTSSVTTNYTTPSTPASVAPIGDVITWANGANSQYATGANGMTLYRFDKDTKGVSNCTGSCAGVWPPYTTASAPGTLPANVTLITRADGSTQFAYKDAPLYYYAGDQKAGDTTGDGLNGIWHLVNP